MRSILRLLVRLFVSCALLTATGCGLDVAGLAPDLKDGSATGSVDGAATPADADPKGSPDSTGPVDAGAPDDASLEPDIGLDAVATDDNSGGDAGAVAVPYGATCISQIPGGWNVVVYDVGGGVCPAGYGTHSVHGTPFVAADACACTCAVTQPGSCAQGNLSMMSGRGNGGGCPQTWLSATIAGSGCTPIAMPSGPPPRNVQASPLPGQGGSCSDTVQPDAAKVSAPAALYCDVPAASADSVCDGAAPSGFASCIATSGVTACPPASPFPQRHVVEDTAVAQCSTCLGCSVSTTCANAVLTTYADSACGGPGTPLTADGTCNAVAVGGGGGLLQSVAAVTYAASASSTCTPGTSTPSAQLVNPQTICCR